MLPGFGRPFSNGLMWVTGEDFVMPNPSQITVPDFSSNWSITSTGRGALPAEAAVDEGQVPHFLEIRVVDDADVHGGRWGTKVGLLFLNTSMSGWVWGFGTSTMFQDL